MSKTFSLIPEQASTIATQVDLLFWGIAGLTIFFTVLMGALVAILAIRYRSGSKVNRSGHGAPHWLETAMMGLMLVIGVGCFYLGAVLYMRIVTPPPNTMEIFVTGRQWMWKIQHPTGRKEINELHVPIGRPVSLIMISEDVLHSFYIPAFRNKMDVLPGRYTKMWFEATKVGEYHLFCAEYCGTRHSGMIGKVVVMEPAAYEAWLSGTSLAAGPSEPMDVAGKKLFAQYGCVTCHEGSVLAPNLAGVYGSSVKLQDGQAVTADDVYMRESILKPQAKIVAGYGPIMPTFEGQIGETQMQQLLAYVKSLKGAGPPSQAASAAPALAPEAAAAPATPTADATAQAPETPEAAGEKLFQQFGCVACHNSPAKIAPPLAGVFGTQVTLQDGQTVLVDEAYVRESITKPQAKVVQGFTAPMPSFEGIANEQQIGQLVAYVKSLK